MDRYVTGAVIKKLRESKKMTQEDLAERIHVSGKAVSKWETGAGFPDISLLEPLAEALGISVIELLSGEDVRNTNRSCNMEKGRFYVCPVCGNVIGTAGETVVSCCGINLPPLEAEEHAGTCGDEYEDEHGDEHRILIQADAGEYYVSIAHPMTKDHYISFIAAVSDRSVQLAKLYPEGSAEIRFRMDHVKHIYAYCNRHGLFLAARPR